MNVGSLDNLLWEDNTLYYVYDGTYDLPSEPTPGTPPAEPATSLTWTNAAGNGVWSSEAVNWVDGGKDYAYTDGLPVRFGDEGAGTVTLVGTLAPGAVVVENSAGADYVFAGEGSMSGAMSLTKKGAGSLTLNASNSYAGGTVVEGGSLVAGGAGSFGTGVITLKGGTLDLDSKAVGNAVTATGGTLSGASAYTGALTVNGDVSLDGTAKAGSLTMAGGTLSGGALADTTVLAQCGAISSKLTGGSSVLANGTVTLGGDNDFTGSVIISSGKLTAGHANALGKGNVTLQGGTLDMGGLAVGTDVLAMGGTLSGASKYAGNLTVMGDATLSGAATADSLMLTNGSLTGGSISAKNITAIKGGIASQVTGETNLTVLGDVALTSANDYTGTTAITGGTLTLGNDSALGGSSVVLTGGTLNLGEKAAANNILATGGMLSGASAYTGSLTVNGNVTLGGTTKAGSITLAAGSLTGGSISNTAITANGGSISSVISGSSAVTSNGAVTISGANTYTGGTSITGGTLTVGHASALGTGAVALNGTLDMGGLAVGNTVNIGSGSLATIVNGSNFTGTVNLNGGTLTLADTLGGALTLNGGVLDLSGMSSASLGTVTTSALTQINVGDISGLTAGSHTLLTLANGAGIDTDLLQIVGMDGITGWNKALELQGNDLVLVLSAITSPTDDIILGGGDKVLDDEVTPDHIEIGGDDDSSISGGGSIAGDGTLDKDGKGDLTIDTENPDWNGDININDGTVIAGNENALGTGDVNLNGGDLDLGGNSIGNDINVNTDATINGGENYQGELTLNDGTVNGGTLNLGQDATVNNGTINNDLTGTGGINKETDGTVTLGGDNSFMGGVNVNGGTLIAGTDTALGTGDVHLNGGTLQLGGHGTSNDIFANGGTLAGAENNKGSLIVDGNVTLAGTTHADGLTMESGILTGGSIHDTDITANGGWILSDITGNGSLTNTGDTTLFGDNSYTGGTTINSGTLTAAGENSLGTGGVTLNGGTLHLGGNGIGNDITVQGDSTLNGAGAYTGTITLKDGTLTGNGINIASGKTFVLENGRIDNNLTGEGGVSKVTDGSVTLGGSNSYSGGTVVDAGTLIAGNDKAFGTGSVTVNGGVLDINGMGIGNNILLNNGATLRGASSAKDITVAAGASVDMAGHSVNAGQTLTTLGGNSIGGGITFNGGTIVMEAPNLTFTDVVSIAGGSVTTLDISAFASSLDRDGLNTLISFDGGLDNYTDGCLALAGVDNTLTQTLTVEDGKLMLALSTPATPPPAVTPAYNVEPSTLGGNRSTVYKQLVDGNRNAELDGVLDSLAQHVDNEQNKDRLAKALDGISGVLYTTQMSAQIDGNRAALGTVRGMMGYGQPLCSGPDDWRFAVQATSANSLMDSRGGAPGYTRRGFGAVVLAETRVDDGIVAGVSLGYEHADVTVDGLDKWKSDDVRFNAHLLVCGDGWQSRTILGIGRHDYDVTRRLGIGDATASSTPSGMSVNLMQEFSYMMELDEESTLEPFFRVESSYNTIDGISETGTAGNASLRIDKQEAWATTLILGARYTQIFTLDGLLNPSRFTLEAGVTKSIGAEGDTLAVRFAGDPAHVYRLDHVDRDRWGVTLEGGVLIPIDDTQSVNASGAIQLRGHQTDYNASVGYSITF